MATAGSEPELKRTLGSFQVFAISFAFISVAVGIFGTYDDMLRTGGPLGIWLWPIVSCGQGLVALVIAQFAARIALTGSSYQWASRLANPKIGWGLGWLTFCWLGTGVVAVDNALASQAFMPLFSIPADEGTARLITLAVLAVQAVLAIGSVRIVAMLNSSAVVVELAVRQRLTRQSIADAESGQRVAGGDDRAARPSLHERPWPVDACCSPTQMPLSEAPPRDRRPVRSPSTKAIDSPTVCDSRIAFGISRARVAFTPARSVGTAAPEIAGAAMVAARARTPIKLTVSRRRLNRRRAYLSASPLPSRTHGRDLAMNPPYRRIGSREYPGDVAHDRDKLMNLAADRRNRMQGNGRPRFDLTDEEIERSTRTAMRLADASKSQAEARAGANTTLPA